MEDVKVPKENMLPKVKGLKVRMQDGSVAERLDHFPLIN